jgi:hypothetical protein
MVQFFLHTEAGHFLIYIGFCALVGGMPAPTATSSVAYKWSFGSLNLLSANLMRISPPRVEKSPNWEPAVKQVVESGKVPFVKPGNGN